MEGFALKVGRALTWTQHSEEYCRVERREVLGLDGTYIDRIGPPSRAEFKGLADHRSPDLRLRFLVVGHCRTGVFWGFSDVGFEKMHPAYQTCCGIENGTGCWRLRFHSNCCPFEIARRLKRFPPSSFLRVRPPIPWMQHLAMAHRPDIWILPIVHPNSIAARARVAAHGAKPRVWGFPQYPQSTAHCMRSWRLQGEETGHGGARECQCAILH